MAVTIKDIARAAGVSHATVSRALRDNPAVSAETTQKIKQLARDMGYVRNRAASGLKTSQSNTIGVIVHRIDDPFFARVYDGIEAVTRPAGFTLLLASTGHDPDKDNEIIASFAERRVDGVIVCSKRFEQPKRDRLSQFEIPLMLINDQALSGSGHAIAHDDVHGSYELTRHLLGLGHQTFVYLGNEEAGMTNADRECGFRTALAEVGVPLSAETILNASNGELEGGYALAERLLARPTLPTALVAFNDLIAVGAMRRLTDAGCAIPRDCSMTGFDDVDLAGYVSPPLTTWRQPKFELGRLSAERLLQLIDDPTLPAQYNAKLRGQLVVRGSTRFYGK